MLITKPHNPLLIKAELLPVPGGGVGGFDKEELFDSPDYATQQHHAEPTTDIPYNKPFGEKGTEIEQNKHGSADAPDGLSDGVGDFWEPRTKPNLRTASDSSMCRCSHQFHEHWNRGRFGCKSPRCRCKKFTAKTGSVSVMPVKIVNDSDNELLKKKEDPIARVAAEEFSPSGKRIEDREEFRASLKKEWEEPDGYLFRSEVYCPKCGMQMIDEMLDTGQIGPPGPIDDPDYVTDAEVIPQPVLSLESGADSCAHCGDPIEKEAINPGEYTPDDEKFMKEMKIWGSLKGLVDTVQPHNPLLQPPDPDTATFFKEGEGGGPHCPHCGSTDYGLMPTDFETAKCNKCGKNWDHGIVDGVNNPYPKTASETSYGTGTAIGGGAAAPARDDPATSPRWTPPTPPAPAQTTQQPDNNSALPAPDQQQAKPTGTEQQQVKQVVNDLAKDNPQVNRAEMEDVAEKVQDKMSALESEVKIYDSTDMLPPRTELRKHLDPTLIDESTKPPRPLSKGGGFTDEDEPEGEVTDMGTLYGKPLGGSTPQQPQSPVFVNQQVVNLTCRKCGKNTGEMAKDEGKSEYMTADKAEARMEEHLLVKHGLPFSPKYYRDTWDPNRAPVRSFRPTKQDKDWMNQLGIKSSKTAADAEGWWRSTQNTERRNVADKLGIGKYWSHFTWDSLPEEIKQKVQMTLPELERNKQIETAWEGPAHVSERDQQIREAWNAPPHTAAGKDWDPLFAKKLYNEGADAAKQGNWDVARNLLVQSLVHNPYNGPANFLLGIVFAQTGDSKAAIHQFEQALRANPKDHYAYHSMVTQMDRDGDLESLEPEVKNFLLDKMVSKQAAKTAVPIEEGNLVCPHCKCDQTKPVEDSEAEGVNLVECMKCGVFFSK